MARAVLALLGLAALGLAATHADAASPEIAAARMEAPTADGALGPGEWDDAARLDATFNGFTQTGTTRAYSVLIGNDADEFFFALEVPEGGEPGDFLVLDFDQGHDHQAKDQGEDYVKVSPAYVDGSWSEERKSWVEDVRWGDGATHGEAMREAREGGGWVYEVRKPFRGGDAHDLLASGGETLGFRVEVRIEAARETFRWPPNTVDHDGVGGYARDGDLGEEMRDWAHLALATPPDDTTFEEGPATDEGNEVEERFEQPGFEAVALLGAAVAAMLVRRRLL